MEEQINNEVFPDSTAANPEAIYEFAVESARLLHDSKCEQVLLLDVRELSQVSDYIVIGTGTSQRQMASTLDHVEDLGRERGFERHSESRDDRSLWLLADFVDVVVHLFEPNTRALYDLEMLWGDAPRLSWNGAEPASVTPSDDGESETRT